MPGPVLLLMKGSPGTGKSAVAHELGRRLRWPVIDKDDVRDLLPDALGGLSYEAMLAIAGRQLRLGLSVIADSPLGYGRAYRSAVRIATDADARVLIVETICSDAGQWSSRISARGGTGLAQHHVTDWARVEAFHARSAADPYVIEVPHLVVDTARRKAWEVAAEVIDWLE